MPGILFGDDCDFVTQTFIEFGKNHRLIIDGWEVGDVLEAVGEENPGYNAAFVQDSGDPEDGEYDEVWVTDESEPATGTDYCAPDAVYFRIYPKGLD